MACRKGKAAAHRPLHPFGVPLPRNHGGGKGSELATILSSPVVTGEVDRPHFAVETEGASSVRKGERGSRRFAKELRRRMTDAECILWSRLRRKLFDGKHRFRNQHPIGPYVADFACVEAWLVIEIDGATHSTDEEVAYDMRRDAFIKARGWRMIRVANQDIYRHLDDVLDGISRVLPLPPPPLRGPPPP